MAKLQPAAKPPAKSTSATTSTSATSSPEVQKLDREIASLDTKIGKLDKQIADAKSKTKTKNASTQKEIDSLKTNVINPMVANATGIMSSAGNTSPTNSASLSNWITEQENKTNEDVSVMRNGKQTKVPFDQLDDKELVNYDLITSPEITNIKSKINGYYQQLSELKQKYDSGKITNKQYIPLAFDFPVFQAA